MARTTEAATLAEAAKTAKPATISRRSFLHAASAAAAAAAMAKATSVAAAAGSLNVEAIAAPLKRLGVQAGSLRAALTRDFAGTLEQIAAIGFREIELQWYGGNFGRTPEQLRAAFDRVGLRATSALIHNGAMLVGWERHLAAAKVIGIEHLAIVNITEDERQTLADCREWADRFNRAGEIARKAGLWVALHNEPPFMTPADGPNSATGPSSSNSAITAPPEANARAGAAAGADSGAVSSIASTSGPGLGASAGAGAGELRKAAENADDRGGWTFYDEFITRTDPSLVTLELDVGNMTRAGYDPISYLRRYPSRYRLFHLKDVPPAGQDGDRPLGRGRVDFPRILAAVADRDAAHFYVEHAVDPASPIDTMRQSYQHLASVS